MKHVSTTFLRIVIGLGGLFVLLFIILVMPEVTQELIEQAPAWFTIPVLGVFFLSAIPFYFVLYQTLRLLRLIDAEHAFSQRAVTALRLIKFASTGMAVMYAAILPLLYIAAQVTDAPGLVAIGIVLTGAATVVATFAAVLQLVLASAIRLKEENDLTV